MVLLSSASSSQTGQCATVIPGNPLPDLIVNQARLKSDIHVTVEKFASTDCAVVEGCVTSKGTHQLLRFTSSVPNVGGGDLVIGDPLQCPNLFEGGNCYNNEKFKDSADYRLWTDSGYQIWVTYRNLSQPANSGINATLLAAAQQSGNVIVGRKQEYCFNDDDQYDPNASPQLRDAGNGAEILRRSGRRDPAQLGAWYRAWHHDRATKLDSDSHEYELCHCEPSNRYGRTCATTTAPAHSKK